MSDYGIDMYLYVAWNNFPGKSFNLKKLQLYDINVFSGDAVV
jgi:hypothetical protein